MEEGDRMDAGYLKWNNRIGDYTRFNNPYAQTVFSRFSNPMLSLRLSEEEYKKITEENKQGIFARLLKINEEGYIGRGQSIYYELREIPVYCKTLFEELQKVGGDLKLADVALHYQKICKGSTIRSIMDIINIYIMTAVSYNLENLLKFEVDANILFNPDNTLYIRLCKDLLDVLEENRNNEPMRFKKFQLITPAATEKIASVLGIKDINSHSTLQIPVTFFAYATKQISWNHQNLDYNELTNYLKELDDIAYHYYTQKETKVFTPILQQARALYIDKSLEAVDAWINQYEPTKKADLKAIPVVRMIKNIPHNEIEIVLEREEWGLNDMTHRNIRLNDYIKRHLMLEAYKLLDLKDMDTKKMNELFTEVTKDIVSSYIFKSPLIHLDQWVLEQYGADVYSKKLIIDHLMAFMDLEFVIMYVVRIMQHMNAHVERIKKA